jgi:hypothetical protein
MDGEGVSKKLPEVKENILKRRFEAAKLRKLRVSDRKQQVQYDKVCFVVLNSNFISFSFAGQEDNQIQAY